MSNEQYNYRLGVAAFWLTMAITNVRHFRDMQIRFGDANIKGSSLFSHFVSDVKRASDWLDRAENGHA